MIDDPDEFSVDHKQRHENNPDLYWDVFNLAASHFRCNVSANGSCEKHWITDGINERQHRKDLPIPEGWSKGRCQHIVVNGIRVKMVGENHPRFGMKNDRGRNDQGQYT